jgi:hypothetical protein
MMLLRDMRSMSARDPLLDKLVIIDSEGRRGCGDAG